MNKYQEALKTIADYQVDRLADGYDESGNLVYDMAYCPNCGREFEYAVNDWGCNYCQDCGQALDWGGDQ